LSEIKVFVFNLISVNTYVISNNAKECIIVDAGCYSAKEEKEIDDYISSHKLRPVRLITTHCHFDHILGNTHIEKKYGIGIEIHKGGVEFLRASVGYASVFGFNLTEIQKASSFLEEGDKIKFGDVTLEVINTPGHANGSICLINHDEKYVLTGDVLFNSSIGRTDLPTGDYDILISSIKNKLFSLPDDYKVYPGHGEPTTIGFEKANNPFFK